jgi:hypothetical protein
VDTLFPDSVTALTRTSRSYERQTRLVVGEDAPHEQTHKYYVSGHYPSSCSYFKTQSFGDWIVLPPSGKSTQLGPTDIAGLYLALSIWQFDLVKHTPFGQVDRAS